MNLARKLEISFFEIKTSLGKLSPTTRTQPKWLSTEQLKPLSYKTTSCYTVLLDVDAMKRSYKSKQAC